MNDLLKRLQANDFAGYGTGEAADTIKSQAKRISELEAEVAALRLDAGRLLDNDAVIDAVAWVLCLQDGNHEESAHTLIWQGQPPEPYGEVWCTYAGKAREVLKAIDAAKEQQ